MELHNVGITNKREVKHERPALQTPVYEFVWDIRLSGEHTNLVVTRFEGTGALITDFGKETEDVLATWNNESDLPLPDKVAEALHSAGRLVKDEVVDLGPEPVVDLFELARLMRMVVTDECKIGVSMVDGLSCSADHGFFLLLTVAKINQWWLSDGSCNLEAFARSLAWHIFDDQYKDRIRETYDDDTANEIIYGDDDDTDHCPNCDWLHYEQGKACNNCGFTWAIEEAKEEENIKGVAELVKFDNLSDDTKAEVKRRYVNWQHDTTARSFEEWASMKAFYVAKDGNLDNRYNHCEPYYLAERTTD